MLKRVVILQERLLRVEGRVEVRQLDLADELPLKLRKLAQAPEGVERVTLDEQVLPCAVSAGTDGPNCTGVM